MKILSKKKNFKYCLTFCTENLKRLEPLHIVNVLPGQSQKAGEMHLHNHPKFGLVDRQNQKYNKNSHLIHALCYWLKVKSPPALEEIQVTYPVRGHSFLPADRAFGRVEKSLRLTGNFTISKVCRTILRNLQALQTTSAFSYKSPRMLMERLQQMYGVI